MMANRSRYASPFGNGTEYPIRGYIDFLDFSVDEQTGTVELRAEFSNSSRLLLPGEFVRAKIYAGKIPNGITIPQQAVTLTGEGGSVYLIDKEGQALVRPIELGDMVDGKWIVESGLKPGDTVIVSNLQKIRPGVPVKISNTPTGRRPAPAPSTAASGKGR